MTGTPAPTPQEQDAANRRIRAFLDQVTDTPQSARRHLGSSKFADVIALNPTPAAPPRLDPRDLRPLIAIIRDSAPPSHEPDIAYVARFAAGVSTHDAFLYPAVGDPQRWLPPVEALREARTLYRRVAAACGTATLLVHIGAARRVEATMFTGDDAAPWMVPLGSEQTLAALARPAT